MQWFIDNIQNLLDRFFDAFLVVANYLITLVFDILTMALNLLPTGGLDVSMSSPSSSNPVWTYLLQSLNYFFDIPSMINLVAVAISLHLSVLAAIVIFRIIQVYR